MPTAVWFALKKSLNCSTDASEVSDPAKSKYKLRAPLTSCGCSRSLSRLKDVVHGSSRSHSERPPSCSPISIASSEFVSPITHEVTFNGSSCDIKILSVNCAGGKLRTGSLDSGFVGTLRPGTPGPRGQNLVPSSGYGDHPRNPRTEATGTPPRSSGTHSAVFGGDGTFCRMKGYPGVGSESIARGPPVLMCQKCGEEFKKFDAVEAHHLSKHAVTELTEADSSRKIVEIICQASWLKSGTGFDRVLKVHNTQKTLARFEQYRETVKIRASKLSKKHPRCLADGNELLRFYGTVIACSLGADSSGLCGSEKCRVCHILRRGFLSKKDLSNSIGIFTASTGERAIKSISLDEEERSLNKALVVCRVIAGRVHKPLENFQEAAAIGPSGFDSVAGKVNCFSNIEELYVLDPKALLPCFVVICRP